MERVMARVLEGASVPTVARCDHSLGTGSLNLKWEHGLSVVMQVVHAFAHVWNATISDVLDVLDREGHAS